MTEVGDELTVKSEIFNIYTGEIILTKGEKVIVSDVEYYSHSGRFSTIRGCEDIYYPLEISTIKIEGHPHTLWRPDTFEDVVIKEKIG